jgi:predicted DNA-binding transcriptional regulator AlpA
MTNQVVRRILRKPETSSRTGYSSAHLCYLERRGKFPRRVKLQPNGAVGWFEDEVDAWLEARAAERDRAAATRVPPHRACPS